MPPPVGAVGGVVVARTGKATRTSVAAKPIRWPIAVLLRRRCTNRDRDGKCRVSATKLLPFLFRCDFPRLRRARGNGSNQFVCGPFRRRQASTSSPPAFNRIGTIGLIVEITRL